MSHVIPIKNSAGEPEELVLLEFQGQFGQTIDNLTIGTFNWNNGKPLVIVQHQIIYGKVKKIDNPLVVMKKIHVNGSKENGTILEVSAVITTQIVFEREPDVWKGDI